MVATMALALATGCKDQPFPGVLEKYCVSESGLANYRLNINVDLGQGSLRYRYMGQDIQYDVSRLRVNGSKLSGLAKFRSSATGEIRANPFSFVYDNSDGELQDGYSVAKCDNLQT